MVDERPVGREWGLLMSFEGMTKREALEALQAAHGQLEELIFDAQAQAMPKIVAELNEARKVAKVTRLVAEAWRDAALQWPDPIVAHPLVMVLTALDGETDPVQLGIGADESAFGLITAIREGRDG